mgnify:CR=1 FL=1
MVTLISTTRPGPAPELAHPTELGLVPAWSISTLDKFETCAYQVYIAKVKKIPEPQGDAAARGETIHKAAENFVNGTTPDLIPELKKYEALFDELKAAFTRGEVEQEGEWGFTLDWVPTGWMAPDVWARIKLDAFVRTSPTTARVIDFKTGKKFGNEVKHTQQGLLYAIGSFMRNPELEFIDVEFWYTDQKLEDKTKKSYTREQALMFLPSFHNRGVRMTTEKNFDPNPSKTNCMWCSFKNGEHPECRWGIKR